MKIRKATINDAKEMTALLRNTIRKVNSKDYSKKAINAWSKVSTSYAKKSIKKRNGEYFIAIINNKIVGYLRVSHKDKIIRALYVHYNYLRKGIGKKLLKIGEKELKKLGVKKSKISSSITAPSFYASQGYKKIRKGYSIINGERISDIKMEKKI